MGIEVVVEGLTKSFGRHVVWRDISLSLPAGEVSVMLGPSGTGKTVFLKSLVGLIRPDAGRVLVDGIDTASCSERDLYSARKLFGVMFQDGALFGSMNLYDNIAFPLREHTRKTEGEIRRIVLEKMGMVGLAGDGHKFPGEISGGMRKRAGLARALVLDPQVILCDEPDSGLDPVRTAYLSQLLIDLNAEIDATILIVTHDIQIARTVPDNIGMLYRGSLVMFGPREVLLTSDHPVITQFVNGRRAGPIGMSEEKDEATIAQEQADGSHGQPGLPALVPQLDPTPGLPDRQAVRRRQARVLSMLHTLPPVAQEAILGNIGPAGEGPTGTRATATLPAAPAPAIPGPGGQAPGERHRPRPGPDDAPGAGELPGGEPTRPGRWRHFLDAPPGSPDEDPADGPEGEWEAGEWADDGDDWGEERPGRPGGWPPDWPGGGRG